MAEYPCIPDESVFTVQDLKDHKKLITSRVKEIQYADKRVVYRNMQELLDTIKIMEEAIYGHCAQYNNSLGRRRYAVTSKGIC